ncbi:transcriptional regulator [Lactobacillus sp. ESL0731]|uniref:helix-turn-helix domain-containing protein n=1 Tax=unclassified Lactobacillus TaxID=2620435 RepID=UPI0023F76301|nr:MULTISPECIES: Rgg/GadR/MutR family transcriptional regulator [unclassified Lactobacillus]WEV51261.1 transcriptional regulator [Lactobacillus sp. ESL0700]WEV62391.1 transcriptional regulator [Lactobacillus sp. ESL0731]
MKIGELLKEYRVSQSKTKKEWAGNVISPSFYARVEKGANRISAEDLIKLLQQNYVSVLAFFSKLIQNDYRIGQEEHEIRRLINEAYYKTSKTELQQIKNIIIESELKNKKDKLMIIDVCLASLNGNFNNLSKNIQQELKDKIFSAEKFDKNNINLYNNCMGIYDFESNLIISKRIIKQCRNERNIIIQKNILAIILNMIILCIKSNHYEEIEFFLQSGQEIITIPETYFYKNMLDFFKNFVMYHFSNDQKFLNICKFIIKNVAGSGMAEYSEELKKFLKESK